MVTVYVNDHPLHLAVVHYLAQFLNANCTCEVPTAPNGLLPSTHWAHSASMRRSSGTHCTSASLTNCHCTTTASLLPWWWPRTALATRSAAAVRSCWWVYFPYTNEMQVLRDINLGHRYKLMKHIEDVILHIQTPAHQPRLCSINGRWV